MTQELIGINTGTSIDLNELPLSMKTSFPVLLSAVLFSSVQTHHTVTVRRHFVIVPVYQVYPTLPGPPSLNVCVLSLGPKVSEGNQRGESGL